MVSSFEQMTGRTQRKGQAIVLKFYRGEALDLVADVHFGLKRRGRGLFRESDARLRKRCTEAWSRYCVEPPARAPWYVMAVGITAVIITAGVVLGTIAAVVMWGAK